MNELDGLFLKLGAKFDASFNQTLGEAEQAIATMGDRMTGAGAALENLLTRPILGAAEAALKLGSDFEQTQIGFATMLGSADKATAMLGNLKEFASKTPFEFPGLVDASKRMLAFGFEAEKIIPTLRTIGDTAAGLGGGAKSIDLITLALGQMQAKGKVSAQEMNQIAEQGVSAWKALAQNIGVSIPEAMKLAEKGAITAAQAIPAILDGMNQQFGGMMAKQADTVAGQWSNMKDQLTFILYDLGAALLPFGQAAVTALAPIGEGIKGAVEWFRQLSPPVQTAVVAFAAIAAAAGPILVMLGTLASSVVAISSAFAVLSGPTALVAAAAALKVVAIAAAAGAAAFAAWKVGEWLYQFGPVKTVLDAVGSAIGGMLQWIAKLPGVSSVVSAMSGAWDGLKSGIEKATAQAANAGKTLTGQVPAMNQLGAAAKAAHTPILGVGDSAETAAKKAAQAAKQLNDHLNATWKQLQGFLLDMPKTMEQASKMMANGFNIDSAIKRTVDEMQKLKIEFGTHMPNAAKQMYAALNINLLQLQAFKQTAENLALEKAFLSVNDAMTAYSSNMGRILKEQAGMTKEVMDISMAAANQAIADVQRLDGAFKQLGVTWSGELASKASKAADAYNLIVEAQKRGAATAVDALRAQAALLQAQIALAKNTGDSYIELESRLKSVNSELVILGAEQDKAAAKTTAANKTMKAGASDMEKAWVDFGKQVSTIMTDFGKDMAGAIIHSKNVGEAFTKMASSIKEAFMRLIIEGAIKEMMKGLDGVSSMLGGIGKQLSGLLGGMGLGGSGGSGGDSGGGGGGLGGMMGGANPLSLVTGITSAFTGILQTLQGRRMEADIGKLEVTSRGQLNQLISIQGTLNRYLPLLEHNIQLVRLEGIEAAIQQLGGGGQGFQQINQSIQTLTEITRVHLRALIDIGTATYSLLNKPADQRGGGGQAPPLNTNNILNSQRPAGQGPTIQYNQTVNATTSDPYRMGQQNAQSVVNYLGARL